MHSQLTDLQREILRTLATMKPRWTLTGGGALAGVHLGHRTTRDLDLFWHDRPELGAMRTEAIEALRASGFESISNQVATSHARLEVSKGGERVILDLVAERVPFVEAPREATVDGVKILVDTPHEILVNKFCALLSRAELRDLRDVRELLAHGGDMARALGDAPRKDTGFSPLVLAWLLKDLPIRSMARVDALGDDEITSLERFRDDLVASLLRSSGPV